MMERDRQREAERYREKQRQGEPQQATHAKVLVEGKRNLGSENNKSFGMAEAQPIGRQNKIVIYRPK